MSYQTIFTFDWLPSAPNLDTYGDRYNKPEHWHVGTPRLYCEIVSEPTPGEARPAWYYATIDTIDSPESGPPVRVWQNDSGLLSRLLGQISKWYMASQAPGSRNEIQAAMDASPKVRAELRKSISAALESQLLKPVELQFGFARASIFSSSRYDGMLLLRWSAPSGAVFTRYGRSVAELISRVSDEVSNEPAAIEGLTPEIMTKIASDPVVRAVVKSDLAAALGESIENVVDRQAGQGRAYINKDSDFSGRTLYGLKWWPEGSQLGVAFAFSMAELLAKARAGQVTGAQVPPGPLAAIANFPEVKAILAGEVRAGLGESGVDRHGFESLFDGRVGRTPESPGYHATLSHNRSVNFYRPDWFTLTICPDGTRVKWDYLQFPHTEYSLSATLAWAGRYLPGTEMGPARWAELQAKIMANPRCREVMKAEAVEALGESAEKEIAVAEVGRYRLRISRELGRSVPVYWATLMPGGHAVSDESLSGLLSYLKTRAWPKEVLAAVVSSPEMKQALAGEVKYRLGESSLSESPNRPCFTLKEMVAAALDYDSFECGPVVVYVPALTEWEYVKSITPVFERLGGVRVGAAPGANVRFKLDSFATARRLGEELGGASFTGNKTVGSIIMAVPGPRYFSIRPLR